MQDFETRRVVMVDTQVRPNDVTKFPIIEAMLNVPRETYVPDSLRELAYLGENLEIAPDRVLLEPRIFAKLLDALNIRSNDLVLDLGCGLGYSSAIIAHLAEAVVAVEEDPLAKQAELTLGQAEVDNIAVVHNALPQGAPQHGPFDVIMIEGAVEEVPDTILESLKEGGRIGTVFMENNLGIARIGIKTDGVVNWRDAFNAAAPVLSGFRQVSRFSL
ncbi:protein-L-isoaspartate O-methyltransferase [Thioclava sp. GXIMD4216]|uniref:Protein-L-isoaspartate O-methyltransferase n=1 Tax=Thioclava litoralis TaxID=3076557 RepID=A0ABZ1E131_9RHOB|nr:protein-L-isoaspartate O-methyltransferase [Thioclava sp. FTW29]